MTEPTAKSVAKELDRRQRRRKLAILVLTIAGIIGAVMFLTCGRGWGIGGKGAGKGQGSGAGLRSVIAVVDAGPKRCAIRITARGTTLDGAIATRDEAVAGCMLTTGADVTVTGDARQGDWDELRAALEAAGVPIEKKQ